jgi:hypothetical protein
VISPIVRIILNQTSEVRIRIWLSVFTVAIYLIQFPGLLNNRVLSSADLALYHTPYSSVPLDQARSYSSLSDNMDQSYGLVNFLYTQLKMGRIPFFSDSSQLGIPFLWNGTSIWGNPLFLVLLLICGTVYSASVYFILLSIIGVVSFYSLLRHWKIQRFPAVIASIYFVFGSFSAATFQWGQFSGFMIFPLLLLSTEKVLFDFSKKWIIFFVVSVMTIVTNGYPPAWAYFLTFYLAYLFFLLFHRKAEVEFPNLRRFGLVCIFSILACGPILAQTFSVLSGNVDLKYRENYWSQILNPYSLMTIFDWKIYGELGLMPDGKTFQWVRHCLFFGLLPLFYVSFVFIKNQNKHLRKTSNFLVIYALLLLALITLPTLNQLVYSRIPVLNLSYASNQYVILLFILNILTAIGLNNIYSLNISKVKYLIVNISVIFIFVLFFVLLAWRSKLVISKNFWLSFVMLILIALFLFYGKKASFMGLASSLIFLGAVLETFPLNPYINWAPRVSQVFPTTSAVEFVKKNLDGNRLLPMGTSFLADTNYAYGFSAIAGRGFFSSETIDFYRRFDPTAFQVSKTQHIFSLNDVDLGDPSLDLVGVKYVSIPTQGYSEQKDLLSEKLIQKFPIVFEGDGLVILERRSYQKFGGISKNCPLDVGMNLHCEYPEDLLDIRSLSGSIESFSGINASFYAPKGSDSYIFPIAFNENLEIKLDGVLVEKYVAVDTLTAINISQGFHQVNIRYKPTILKPFFLLTYGVSVLVLVYWLFFQRRAESLTHTHKK